MLETRPVRGSKDFRRFIDYAYTRNANDPHWVPPLRLGERDRLNPKKNPFFTHAEVALFLVGRDGRVAGRIAAIDDRRHNDTHRDNACMFGFFGLSRSRSPSLSGGTQWGSFAFRVYA